MNDKDFIKKWYDSILESIPHDINHYQQYH